jgi:broad specificity phosphatase PhoE
MKHIYLFRHGETEINASPVIHSSPDNPLSKKGHIQAEHIAERCTKLPLEVLLTSPYTRARETAEHISKKTGLQPVENELFHECEFISKYFSQPRTPESAALLKEIISHWGEKDFRVDDEENFHDIYTRATQALDALVALPEEHIGVVTHGLFLRHLIGVALLGDHYTPAISNIFARSMDNENTGMSVLRYKEDRPENPWMLWVFNDHAHLG